MSVLQGRVTRKGDLVTRITVTLSIFNFSTRFFAQIVENRETQLSSPFLGPGDNFSKSYDENQISTRHVHVNIGEKQYKYFEILYEILYEILFRTMQPRSARAREQNALSKFREHAGILCAMSEPHVHYRVWNRDRQLALRKARPSWGHAYQDLQYTMPNFHDPHY